MNMSGNNSLTCSPIVVNNPWPAKVAKISAYVLVMVVSFIGNTLLVAIVYRHRKTGMWTTTNCFIVNMAVSDLIVPTFAVPNRIFNIVKGSSFLWFWHGTRGLVLCKFLNFVLDVSTAVSIQSLVAIAVDRFYAVSFPLRAATTRTSRVCAIVIPLIWLSAIAFHAVYFYIFRIMTVDKQTFCLIDWKPHTESKAAQKPYYTSQFVILYALPLISITMLYCCVVSRLRSKTLSTHKPLRRRRSEQNRNRKVTRMCVIAVLVFAICWAPIHVYSLLFHFVWNWTVPCGLQELTFTVFFAAYLYAAINPIIYFIFSEKYRRGLERIVKCQAVKVVRRPSDSSWRSRSSSGFGMKERNSSRYKSYNSYREDKV